MEFCYGALYQFPPLGSSAAGILLRVSCIFVADGAEIGLRLRVALSGSCYAVTGKSRGFARSGALGLPGAGHGLASLSGRINEEPEWCFVRKIFNYWLRQQ